MLDRNPLEWSVEEVVQFISSTDCCSLANIFKEQVCLKVQRERRGDFFQVIDPRSVAKSWLLWVLIKKSEINLGNVSK